MFKSKFLKIMNERGFIHNCTNYDGLDKILLNESVISYIGFDCNASSLHVGSLVQIMMLYWLKQTGHKPIVLMGGGTTKIGDPSGKDEARTILDDVDIRNNMNGISKIFDKVLVNPNIINNALWLDNLDYVSFLRDVGRHFSINRMLTMESVKRRLEREQSLSFLEFNYMLLQAYDFLELAKQGCKLQLGGSDQWGNIVNGIDLTHKVLGTEVFGLTSPLIMTAAGIKMGKSVNGAIWLNEEMLTVYDYWQFWRNIHDNDVIKFLKLFTTLSLNEIKSINDINQAKIILADEATMFIHCSIRMSHEELMAYGEQKNWWIDKSIPIKLFVVKLGDYATFATCLSELKIFKSTNEAKRNGWNTPLEIGEYLFKKKTLMVRVIT